MIERLTNDADDADDADAACGLIRATTLADCERVVAQDLSPKPADQLRLKAEAIAQISPSGG